ncbi:MAG TPA: hypothetical protein VHX61_05580 [Rhizomicrobium sp.]|jgi:hypothetical protein|nr:hypothetical protein [Rhizomicrobium sp.]
MIVIHIGLKKCGSASLQTFLSTNEKQLSNLSIEYPRAGRDSNSQDKAGRERKAHNNIAKEILGVKRPISQPRALLECVGHWAQITSRTMVLSSEVFEGATKEGIQYLKQAFLRWRPEEQFTIFLMIRDLIDIMPSSYAQKIKHGFHTYDFDTFFAGRIEEPRVHYFDTAERWADVFGWDSMQIRLLDRCHLTNGDLLDDFLAMLSESGAATDGAVLNRTGVMNSAPGWKTLEAIRALFGDGHSLPEHHRLWKFVGRRPSKRIGICAVELGEKRGWNRERGRYLTREQAERCLAIYAANVEKLNRRALKALPLPASLGNRGFMAREFMPKACHISRYELHEFYNDLAGSLEKVSAARQRVR